MAGTKVSTTGFGAAAPDDLRIMYPAPVMWMTSIT